LGFRLKGVSTAAWERELEGSFDSGVRPFDFAQGRLSLRMTTVEDEPEA
jgi:hypothetical protein